VNDPYDATLVFLHIRRVEQCVCVWSSRLSSLYPQRSRFLRATAVPAGTAEARISYGDSVRLSVCLSQPGAETTE